MWDFEFEKKHKRPPDKKELVEKTISKVACAIFDKLRWLETEKYGEKQGYVKMEFIESERKKWCEK